MRMDLSQMRTGRGKNRFTNVGYHHQTQWPTHRQANLSTMHPTLLRSYLLVVLAHRSRQTVPPGCLKQSLLFSKMGTGGSEDGFANVGCHHQTHPTNGQVKLSTIHPTLVGPQLQALPVPHSRHTPPRYHLILFLLIGMRGGEKRFTDVGCRHRTYHPIHRPLSNPLWFVLSSQPHLLPRSNNIQTISPLKQMVFHDRKSDSRYIFDTPDPHVQLPQFMTFVFHGLAI